MPDPRNPLLSGLEQVGLAALYYGALVLVVRLSGKRMAGQTTTFDLLVLITLGVVLQTTALRPGSLNALVFVATVFACHRALASGCARSKTLRRWVRGAARPLIEHGQVSFEALVDEGLTYDELLAGLRKSGHQSPRGIRLATLEETGHISAIAEDAQKESSG